MVGVRILEDRILAAILIMSGTYLAIPENPKPHDFEIFDRVRAVIFQSIKSRVDQIVKHSHKSHVGLDCL